MNIFVFVMIVVLGYLSFYEFKNKKIENDCECSTDETYLIFDTETSGLSAEKNDILQLSYQVVDECFNVIKSRDCFFEYPIDEARVSPKAIEVNGLTKEVLSEKCNSTRKEAILEFISDVNKVTKLVAHNGFFDVKFIDAWLKNNGYDKRVPSSKMYDTMKSTVELCKLPRANGGYKYPKLYELADVLQIDYSDLKLHDSMADVELTTRCFKKLNEMCVV